MKKILIKIIDNMIRKLYSIKNKIQPYRVEEKSEEDQWENGYNINNMRG